MAPVQIGWAMPRGAGSVAARPAFAGAVRRGLDLVAGTFDSAWMIDHLQLDGGDVLEGWTALTYWAAQEPRLRFGHTVLCQSFRNPALLAKMAATLQYLSGGRYILGLGAGWKEDEYRAYGYRFPPASVRVAELEETLRIVRALWTEERAIVEGAHYQAPGATCAPRPDPAPPIMVGAEKPRMLRLVARYADWWNVSKIGLADYTGMVAECARACAAAGRDPATLRRSWHGNCFCAPTPERLAGLTGAIKATDRMGAANALIGTPEEIVAQMRGYMALGVDYFMLSCGGFPDLTTLETLIANVLPALSG
jgi:alkanesulfonate monooxygenase SsuD/methylene tetrahydromethanopterin reductase-like flavin-dependent oxidoreductase (luciferase family)